MASTPRPLAVVTGASTGIGRELARIAAERGYDLVIAADEARIDEAERQLRTYGGAVTSVQADLATMAGVDELVEAVRRTERPVELLMANAGLGLGHAFLDQDIADWRRVVDTNITGTLYLTQKIGREMRARGAGRILITGSIAGFMPGSFQAVYNGTKAFLNSFSFALRNELQDANVSVTCLMPGPTDTEFFERAGMMDTSVGQGAKDDPADVAEIGFQAMMDGEGDVVSGWKNKVQAAVANVTPSAALAAQHRRMAEPGSGQS
ncbi:MULTISPECIES: SDR family NAD(P)-dependent oxidoreductase [unclassified Chelatococcus]|uniref:SDR family NAD(P)-dependent oxidoreductase n=1 Tax=unclassified Chelatococcus TaxID=2638111 RepID=UPI001BCE53BC|nr:MULTISPECIES: SDR family NAD(P)-dependent oxidoreductase [unclassified Chelatococcus]MBS7700054.1 SDR family NAD(P)-dependent oxidoreductase [Chelatococcus sp. YT9]MBX3556747.1 SDR family NAD(P)-dependent oxidoreductase [Chelatococcus sp.]